MQLITITRTELSALIAQALRTELVLFKKKFDKKPECDIITRKEAAIMLRIDLSTLWEWTKDGKLKAQGIGRRVYYKRSEIEKCLTDKNCHEKN